jgi:hypothetical protein
MQRTIILFLLASVGCGGGADSLRGFSAGLIGCPPEQITILKDSGYGFGARSWQAACYGKTYQCSGAMNTGQCTLLQAPPGAPADGSPPAGSTAAAKSAGPPQ